MSTKYAIDACSLINISKNYNIKKKAFAHVWEKLDEMFENGELLSSSEIFEELKDDDLLAWAKKHKNKFVPLSKEIQNRVSEILSEYPEMIKIRSVANSNGDPFLLATAIENNCCVVTDEGSGDYKLPNICKKYNIDFMNLQNFFNIIFE